MILLFIKELNTLSIFIFFYGDSNIAIPSLSIIRFILANFRENY